ncbi:MAG: metal-dependent hydrolase, partial [Candidatus Latescibacteria bacterium]|nr:metal-dependent hydrolase [Candidatus Latescibacterota bacterium]
MSGHKGHLAAGLIAYGALLAVALIVELSLGVKLQYLLRSWLDIPIQIMVLALFSLWPDVDIASKARKLSYRLALALDLYLLALAKWEAAAFVGLAAILPGIGKHRGWTHTVAAALLLPVPILLVPLFVTG